MIRRLFLALFLLACHRTPEKITKSEVVDAPPAPPPAPLRPIPNGRYASEDGARIQLELGATGRAVLVEHEETERAPLTATGKYTSRMESDGSFVVDMTVESLEKKFLSKCLDCRSKDIDQRFDNVALDGEPLKKGAVAQLTLKFSDDDRVLEMCFTSSKKCERLKRG